MQEYVEEGTLRIEWRDFPYLGQESVNAAMAARAAQAQGKFWEYHDLLYQNQSGGFPDEKLVALAREAGLDEKGFEADLASGEYGVNNAASRAPRRSSLTARFWRGASLSRSSRTP